MKTLLSIIVVVLLSCGVSMAKAEPTIVHPDGNTCLVKAVSANEASLDNWWFCINGNNVGLEYQPNITIFNMCETVLPASGQFQDISAYVDNCDDVVGVEDESWGSMKSIYR